MGSDGASVTSNPERALAEVNGIRIGFQQPGAPTLRLGFHQIHQIWPQYAVREAGEIFHMRGGHQLATGDATSLKSGDQERAEVGAGCIDRSRVTRWTGADDHQIFHAIGGGGRGSRLTSSGHGLGGMTMT